MENKFLWRKIMFNRYKYNVSKISIECIHFSEYLNTYLVEHFSKVFL